MWLLFLEGNGTAIALLCTGSALIMHFLLMHAMNK